MTLQKLSAYGKGFQIKVLGALLTQKDFLINVRDTLKSEYFDTDTHKWVVDKMLQGQTFVLTMIKALVVREVQIVVLSIHEGCSAIEQNALERHSGLSYF